MRFPSIAAVAAKLKDAKVWCEPDIDVRLQILPSGDWSVHTGDAQYDTDHRGSWGASSLTPQSNCREVARDLIEQAKDDYAQYQA